MNVQQIAFTVPGAQFEALRQRAGRLNIKPAEYAKRLFDAAYYVRCVAEKGEPIEDTRLDVQVRNVFLLADCEPEYIADALGFPQERVTRILDGWRQAALELARPVQKAAPAAEPTMAVPPPVPSRSRNKARTFSAAELETIRSMWVAGETCRIIAAALGCDERRVSNFVFRRRDICPSRRGG